MFILFLAVFSLFFGNSFPLNAAEVTAKAAVVIDGETGRLLYAKNPDLKLQPASTTKLMAAMVALDHLDADHTVKVSKKAAATPSVEPRLRPGAEMTVRELLYLALMRSINGASVALAEATAGSESAFAGLMNKKCAQIGASDTRFINASGLPGQGQYITARNLATVMKASLEYPLIREIINTREITLEAGGRQVFLKNTNRLLWADDDLIGGKTGYTRAARHCLVFAASKGDITLVAAILGAQARDGLWQQGEMLLATSNLIASGVAEPEIYVTDSSPGPVMLASYSTGKSWAKIKVKKQAKKKKATKSVKRKKPRAPAHKQKKPVVAEKQAAGKPSI